MADDRWDDGPVSKKTLAISMAIQKNHMGLPRKNQPFWTPPFMEPPIDFVCEDQHDSFNILGTEGVTSASAPQNWMPWRARRTGVGQGWTVLDGPAIWGLYGVS